MAKVLVIDDSAEVRSLLAQTLQSNGYEVFTAEDGILGVELAQRHLPDVILCDVNMPRLDGYSTLTALRQHSGTATIPVIFLSGLSDKVHLRQGMELGADDYLTKPIGISELLSAISVRLERKSALRREAEKKLEMLRGNLSLALPHELLTPLTAIVEISSLLMEKSDSVAPSELFELATGLNGSALRLQRTVENFLLYSQLELVAADSDKVAKLREGEFVLDTESIRNAALRIARRVGREADLVVQMESATLPIAPDKLQRAVSELIDNAFKFSRHGDPVTLASFTSADGFSIAITDHGCGMTADQIASIGAHMQFERKFHEQQGSGLGLIIAKRLTELHGGSFVVESAPGEQTTVHLTFSTLLPRSSREVAALSYSL